MCSISYHLKYLAFQISKAKISSKLLSYINGIHVVRVQFSAIDEFQQSIHTFERLGDHQLDANCRDQLLVLEEETPYCHLKFNILEIHSLIILGLVIFGKIPLPNFISLISLRLI